MSKQGKDGALSALQELLQRIAADHPNEKWLEIARTHGIGFLTGQAEKKLKEAQGMDADAWEREMLGAINYAAMAMLYRFVVVPSDADEQAERGCSGGTDEG